MVEVKDVSGHQAFIYAEQQPGAQKETETDADAITKPTDKAWEQGEPIPLSVDGDNGGDVGPTRMVLDHFRECIVDDKEPLFNVKNGHDSAICVVMGNNAMRNERVESWKMEYAI